MSRDLQLFAQRRLALDALVSAIVPQLDRPRRLFTDLRTDVKAQVLVVRRCTVVALGAGRHCDQLCPKPLEQPLWRNMIVGGCRPDAAKHASRTLGRMHSRSCAGRGLLGWQTPLAGPCHV